MENNTFKWATFENADASKTLKQHAFQDVIKKHKMFGTVYTVAQSLCGRVMVGEGDTLAEASKLGDIYEEVLNPDKACKICQKLYANATE